MERRVKMQDQLRMEDMVVLLHFEFKEFQQSLTLSKLLELCITNHLIKSLIWDL